MPPPSATLSEQDGHGEQPSADAPLEPGLSDTKAKVQKLMIPGPPVFENKHEEREFLKGRLAAAFRIFGKEGFDEGVAGHITVRVCAPP